MKLRENVAFLSFLVIVILLTTKIWIKLTFEIQILGLILLIGLSWTLKFFIIKAIKKNVEKKKNQKK